MRAALFFALTFSFAVLGSDEEALLKAIRDNPDEDSVRLVYADWLDEHDRPERAEFIRLQVRLARMGSGDSQWLKLLDRQRELLKDPRATGIPSWFAEHEAGRTFRPLPPLINPNVHLAWTAVLSHPRDPALRLRLADLLERHDDYATAGAIREDVLGSQIEVKFHRGFLERISCGDLVFVQKGAQLLAETPFLRELDIRSPLGGPDIGPDISRVLTSSPITGQLHSLALYNVVLTPGVVRNLAPKLSNLRSLELGSSLRVDALSFSPVH